MDTDGPAAVLEGVAHHYLAAVGGIVLQLLLLVAAVDGLAEPETLVAAAVGKAEAARQGGVEEIGDREVEREGLRVEAGRHQSVSIRGPSHPTQGVAQG